MIVKRISTVGKVQHAAVEKVKLKSEFRRHFIVPLLTQTARGNNEYASGIGSHDQFTDKQTSHDGFTGTRIIGKDESQRLPGKHGFIDCGNLMGKRLHIGSVDGHHRIKEISQADAIGFCCPFEILSGDIKTPRAFRLCNGETCFIFPCQQTFPQAAIIALIKKNGGVCADNLQHDDFCAFSLLNSRQNLSGCNIFEAQHYIPLLVSSVRKEYKKRL